MKRIIFGLIALVFMLGACSVSGSVTPPAPDLPVKTDLPVNSEVPVRTESPVSTEVPRLGSTRVSETDGMALVFVPGGDFTMGSDGGSYANERPAHTVFLESYWIDQTEVTNAMFEAFVTQTGYQTDAESAGFSRGYDTDTGKSAQVQDADWEHPLGPDSSLSGLADHPVVHVSWNDARAYCEWAGRRLLTEAEWEKAARGTDGRTFPWGNDFDGTRLNSADVNLGAGRGSSSFDDGFQLSSPVGSYPRGASPYGAMDMVGNVWEWVSDWVDEAYYQSSPSANPGGPASGEHRIVRGGSWHDPQDGNRAAYRGWATPEDTDITLGFRCGLTP
ncbi:MAG: formylglycine-generating enzyme family protein [Gemmatimonadales bacterium]|nr:MAG: formylglycine-generating enzyme family protein [Gemmatimonadales bacterium]